MAQVLGQKARVGKVIVSRPLAAKGLGDTAENNGKTKTKSKSIPKAVRDDLENALVNLCDVWFEEIKPHLIRNNIKLHVHKDPASGEGRKPLPTGAPGCSHLDPGAASDQQHRRNASSADCCPMQRTASKVHYHKLQPPRSSPQRHRPSAPPMLQNQNHNGNGGLKRRYPKRTKDKQTQSESRMRIPRLCNVLSLVPKSNEVYRKAIQYQNNTNLKNNNKCKTKDKYTQTDYHNIGYKDVATMPKTPRTALRQSRRVSPNRHKKNRTIESSLFQKDLIDIICTKREKSLEMIYKSPAKSDISSVMNLITIEEYQNKNFNRKKKVQPWK